MSEIIMFGRELTGEQIKGFVSCEEKDGEIRIPSKWVRELCDNRTELETLRSENDCLNRMNETQKANIVSYQREEESLKAENALLSERVKELEEQNRISRLRANLMWEELSALKESKTVYVRRCK